MTTNVVILGGGVVGLEVAKRLARQTHDQAVTVVDLDGVHVYQPLLPEVAAGVIEPRHAVVPLRAALPTCRILNGEGIGMDPVARTLRVRRRDGVEVDLPFDHLVVAPGSVTRVFPIPGLVDRAVGFQTVAEALYLRDHVLDCIQLAEAATDPSRRARALTFVFVGAGYSGVEAVGELQEMAAEACRQFIGVEESDVSFILIEATERILPMVSESLRDAAVAELERRGIDVRLSTLVESVDDHRVHLSDGTTVATDTLVWCAGARPHPVVSDLGLPLEDDGSVQVSATLEVYGMPGVWSAGDCAAVPDLEAGGRCPGSAQYALRQGRRIADNITRSIRGEAPQPFRYRQIGEMITLGGGVAVGYLGPVQLRGRGAWILRAGYHVVRFPTVVRKLRMSVDWMVNLAFPREITSLGSARHPARPIHEAAGMIDEEVSWTTSD